MSRLTLLEYAEEQRKMRNWRIQRRQLRDASNPLHLPDREFILNYRLDKTGFLQLLEELLPFLPQPVRKTAIRSELKILATLNFFANGSYQRNVGASYLYSMSQPTFSKCLHEVTDALNVREVLLKYVKFPSSRQHREIIMREFMEKFGFPGIIGCIDGTHVALVRPIEHEEAYFNRKNYHSLNVLIICDANLNILHADASFGGASHDSFVWNQCHVKTFLESLERNGEHCWLLGDSGYAQRPWMMTPILEAAPGSPEQNYTDHHCRVRNTVERCIGVLKARWRCLLAHRTLHYDPVTAAKIVNSCVVLHNIANARNTPMPEPTDDIENNQQNQVSGDVAMQITQDNYRDRLVQRLWDTRLNI